MSLPGLQQVSELQFFEYLIYTCVVLLPHNKSLREGISSVVSGLDTDAGIT